MSIYYSNTINLDNKVPKVFLGGTCNESTWREMLIQLLDMEYFNPVVDDWTEEMIEEEKRQRELCDYVLYTVTPKMTGVYSIAEAVDDSNKRPNRTIFCILPHFEQDEVWDEGQIRSLNQVAEMISLNGGKCFTSLEDVASYLNNV